MLRDAARSFALLAALVLAVAPLPAQTPPASPFLEPDHWVVEMIRRLQDPAAGGAALAARRTPTRQEAARTLRIAASGDGAEAERARRALERLVAEFPDVDSISHPAHRLHGSASLGAQRREGGLRTGTGYGRDGIPAAPPVAGGDYSGPSFGGTLTAALGDRFAATFDGGYAREEWRVESLHGVLAAGPLLLWGGRRAVGFGPGEGGGVVFGDRVTVDGGGVQLARPITPPGFLRHLGAVHFEMLLTREGESGQVRNPWLWGARGSLHPHPRLALGINRGALFGGEGNVGTSLRDLLYIAIGKHASEGSILENQILSVDLVYRPPLPLAPEAYLEWGLEDSAGAWREVPGVLWGASLRDLPGLPGVRLGLEHVDFARSCCGNPIWYRHIFLHAGWTAEGEPMGHPLGGHGEEWLAYGSGGLLSQRLQLRGSVAFRDRWHENLFAPDREGASTAGTLRASWVDGRWIMEAEAAVEDGSGWRETRLAARLRLLF